MQSLYEISYDLKQSIAKLEKHEIIQFVVLNPDVKFDAYSGEIISKDGKSFIYRSYKSWCDLAQNLGCKILTPKKINEYLLELTYMKLNTNDSFHKDSNESEDKYGVDSSFFKINKNEESAFLEAYVNALKYIDINKRIRILNLGVNRGDEFEVIKKITKDFSKHDLLGIDYSKSAIEFAKNKFKTEQNIIFECCDIKKLDELDLDKFNLIVSIGTLQSSNLNFNEMLMTVVQKYLKKDGAIVLGFPNCRWIDGEMIYGAKTKNYSFSEMSLLIKDIHFCKKYLQQKKFKVMISGKEYVFLAARSINK